MWSNSVFRLKLQDKSRVCRKHKNTGGNDCEDGMLIKNARSRGVIVQLNYCHSIKYSTLQQKLLLEICRLESPYLHSSPCEKKIKNQRTHSENLRCLRPGVADPIGTQEDVGLLFPCSLIFGYHHYLPVRSKVPSIHGVFRAEPPCCLNIMAVIWHRRDNWAFHPQALEITSTGGRWMMARKWQRPGDDSLTICNFSIIHIITSRKFPM